MPRKQRTVSRVSKTTRAIEQALRRARQRSRKTARMYGTPFYTMKNGKIVAEKP
jgi:hypothetical protein